MVKYRDDDDDGIVADGESVRRPMFLMDSVDAEWALHRPGYRYATDARVEDARISARDAYIKRTSEAWHDAGRSENAWMPNATNVATNVEPEPDLNAAEPDIEAAQRRRDEAYAAHKAQQANAWKTTFVGAGPDVVGATARRVGPGSTR